MGILLAFEGLSPCCLVACLGLPASVGECDSSTQLIIKIGELIVRSLISFAARSAAPERPAAPERIISVSYNEVILQ